MSLWNLCAVFWSWQSSKNKFTHTHSDRSICEADVVWQLRMKDNMKNLSAEITTPAAEGYTHTHTHTTIQQHTYVQTHLIKCTHKQTCTHTHPRPTPAAHHITAALWNEKRKTCMGAGLSDLEFMSAALDRYSFWCVTVCAYIVGHRQVAATWNSLSLTISLSLWHVM